MKSNVFQVVLVLLILLPICAAEFTSEQLTKTFFNAILSINQLNIPVAKAVLSKFTENHHFIGLVGGTVPLFHHLFNLFMQSGDPSTKKGVIEITLQCVQLGADVNEEYKQDPPVMFKSLMFKELALAGAYVEKTNIQSLLLEKSHWFGRFLVSLYSVPGEPVPFAKLLLHADNIVRGKGGYEAIGGLAGVKTLISGGSLNSAKPTVKVSELATDSETYNELLARLGSSGNDVLLRDIVRSLDEVSSNLVHRRLLDHVLIKNDLTTEGAVDLSGSSLLVSTNFSLLDGFIHAVSRTDLDDVTRRNALHYLAMSGSAIMTDDLTTWLSKLLPEDNAYGIDAVVRDMAFTHLSEGLQTADYRGHSALSYAVMRYGQDSAIAQALSRLCTLVELDFAALTANVVRYDTKRSEADDSATAEGEADSLKIEDISLSTATDSTLKKKKKSKSHAAKDASEVDLSGGWQLTPTTLYTHHVSDIQEVFGAELPSNKEFFAKYVNTSTPVVFRGAAMESSVRDTLSKREFVARYGGFAVPQAVLPYSDSFGVRSQQSTLKQVVDAQTSDSAKQFSMKTQGAVSPMYTFCLPSSTWSAQLQRDIPTPRVLLHSLEDDSQNCNIGDYNEEGTSWPFELQFYLGHVNTGAPVHFHGHAVNTLAYGEKVWFLYPPSEAHYTTATALDHFNKQHQHHKVGAPKPLVVVQRAGDVLYVPALWGHATLNTQQSIGVAHEFSVEPFCME